MTRLMFAVALGAVLSAGAVEYSPSAANGDLTTPGNWTGGALPGSGDAANVDGASTPLDAFTLSDDLSVGAFGVTNWSRAVSFDLGGRALSVATAHFTGAGPMALTNGTLQTAGKVAVGASSTLVVKKGASILFPANVSNGNELSVAGAGAKLVIDGGLVKAPAAQSAWTYGNRLGDWNGKSATLEVRNGGVFEVQAGKSELTMLGGSHLVVDNGSTFAITNATDYTFAFAIGQGGNTIAVTNSAFRFFKLQFGGSNQMQMDSSDTTITFHNAIVRSTIKEDSGSGLELYEGANYRTVRARVRMTGAETDARFSVNFNSGSDNVVELVDGTHSGRLYFKGGERNGFRMSNATKTGVSYVDLGGISNFVSVCGGTFGQNAANALLRFYSGTDALFEVKERALAYVGQWGDNPAMTFSSATNALIRIDDATIKTLGYLDLSGTVAPGTRFEFAGAAPQLQLYFWQTVRQTEMAIGAAEAANKNLVPRLRFRLPSEPYANPVVTTADSWFRVAVNPTAVLEFDFSDCGRSRRTRTYPLIDRIPSLSAETLAALDATAALPDGCRLVATKNLTSNNANGTWLLSLVVKGEGGTQIIFR